MDEMTFTSSDDCDHELQHLQKIWELETMIALLIHADDDNTRSLLKVGWLYLHAHNT